MTKHCPNPICLGLQRDGATPEFIDEMETCLDCGCALMRGVAPEDPHEPPRFRELRTIFIATDEVQAHLVSGVIEAEGISVHRKGEALTSAVGELPATVRQIEIQVADEDRDRARAIVLRFEGGRGRGTES